MFTVICVVGCGHGGPRIHPVRGQVELAGADVKHLTGSHVELVLATDPKVRASGEIQEDGTFKLQSNDAGGILDGTREGTYQVRIILSDDDRERSRRAAQALAARYLDFRSSGLTISVPATGPVTIALANR